jgi:hypothetical protein
MALNETPHPPVGADNALSKINTDDEIGPSTVTLSTFAALSVNSAKGLSRWAARCFAEFTLSAANVLSMTTLYLPVTLRLRSMRITADLSVLGSLHDIPMKKHYHHKSVPKSSTRHIIRVFGKRGIDTIATSATSATIVTNSPKSGIVNQPYRMLPDLYGSYLHSYHVQLPGSQPVIVQAKQLAKVSALRVARSHHKSQI